MNNYNKTQIINYFLVALVVFSLVFQMYTLSFDTNFKKMELGQVEKKIQIDNNYFLTVQYQNEQVTETVTQEKFNSTTEKDYTTREVQQYSTLFIITYYFTMIVLFIAILCYF